MARASILPSLKGVRLVSWDLDGTLYSLQRLRLTLIATWPGRALRLGVREAHAELACLRRFRAFVEKQRQDRCEVLANGPQEQADQDKASELLVRALARMAPPPTALAWLDEVARAGVPQVVLSDFAPGPKLAALGLEQRFLATYSCQALGFWKPSAVPFQQIEQRHRVLPGEHLHIGDRADTDGKGALRAGCRFLAFEG